MTSQKEGVIDIIADERQQMEQWQKDGVEAPISNPCAHQPLPNIGAK
jgi:hypothetical protein